MHATSPSQIELFEALQRGGVDTDVSGSDRYEVFRNVVHGLPSDWKLDRELLLDQLLAREMAAGIPIAEHIAIPHPRYPLLAPSLPLLLRICYLSQPLPYPCSHPSNRRGGAAVDIVLLLLAPNETAHGQLLAQLTLALKVNRFLDELSSHQNVLQLLASEEWAQLLTVNTTQGNPA